MADDMMMKLAGDAATRLNERLLREERDHKAARFKCDATRGRERLAEDEVLRRAAERLSNGTLH